MTRELTEEYEPTGLLPRWMTALNMDMLFSINTVEAVAHYEDTKQKRENTKSRRKGCGR